MKTLSQILSLEQTTQRRSIDDGFGAVRIRMLAVKTPPITIFHQLIADT
jgi:hypothetical protein